MDRRKINRRLPNHFGSIRFLGKGRKNAYAVHMPAISNTSRSAGVDEGASTTSVDNGAVDNSSSTVGVGHKAASVAESSSPHTFQEVYDSFIDHRFGPNAIKKRKRSTKNCYNSAWLKLEPFYNLTLDQVDVDTLESRVNLVASWGYSKTTVSKVVTLIHQLYKYAFDRGYCMSRHGLGVEMPDAKEEVHHQDFTDEEIDKLWEVYHTHSGDSDVPEGPSAPGGSSAPESPSAPEGSSLVLDTVRMILIMVYSGFRSSRFAGARCIALSSEANTSQ